MDLRKEFENILKAWGHNILLQRAVDPFVGNEKIRYENKVEKHTVRSMFPSSNQQLDVAEETQAGIRYDTDMIFYFKWDVNPTASDRIYEHVPGMPNNQITYVIDWADPKHGAGGRIEYWTVGASKESPN